MSTVQATAEEMQEEGIWMKYCEATGTDPEAIENGVLDPKKLLEVPSDIAWVLIEGGRK